MTIQNTLGIIALSAVLTLGAIACTQPREPTSEVDDVIKNEDTSTQLATTQTEEAEATTRPEAATVESTETREVVSSGPPATLPATGAPEPIQGNVEAQPYDNEPSVTGVPCAVWTCRDAQGRSEAELQAQSTPGPFKTEIEAESAWEAAGRESAPTPPKQCEWVRKAGAALPADCS